MDLLPTPTLEKASAQVAAEASTAGGRSALLLVDRFEREGADILVITFNRPAQRNPIDKDTIAELTALLTQLAKDGEPDAIVLTGSGNTFSAGGDLKGYQGLYRDPARFRRFMQDFDAACDQLERSSALTIAMVNGTCIAGGLEIALSCDLITMSAEARVGDGHLRFGQLPGAGGSQRLVRAIGLQRARHWLLTGRLFDAETAREAGLPALVAVPDQLVEETLTLAASAAQISSLGRSRMKELILYAVSTPLAEGLALEQDLVHCYATTSHDATEGLHAFSERRPPRYLGR